MVLLQYVNLFDRDSIDIFCNLSRFYFYLYINTLYIYINMCILYTINVSYWIDIFKDIILAIYEIGDFDIFINFDIIN